MYLRDVLAADHLTWWPEIGVGWYPVTAGRAPYDRAYFERFASQAATPLGRALMEARCLFVEKHFTGTMVDVGIGSGAFIEARERRGHKTYGYDVNPAGIAWLEERRLFANPYVISRFEAATFWDALEHISDFRPLIANIRKWLFISVPIFKDAEHVLRSKHYRKDEHCWYFTRGGLVWVMDQLGFGLVDVSDVETQLGREDILSFAFRRKGEPTDARF